MQKHFVIKDFKHCRFAFLSTALFFCTQVCAVDESLIEINPKSLGTTQLMRQTKELLEHDRLSEAVPFLKESLIRFSELDGEGFKEARTEGMYQLGLCYLETSQFTEAVEIFQRFLKEYPSHTYATASRILVLESLARLGDSELLRTHISKLDDSGEFAVLESALKDSTNADLCRNAVVSLLKAYALKGNANGVQRFWSLADNDAQHDISLHYAFMEGGDFAVEQNRFSDALKLFGFVKTKADLLAV